MHEGAFSAPLTDPPTSMLSPDHAWPAEFVRRYQAAGYWQRHTLASQILAWQQQYAQRQALRAEGKIWTYDALVTQAGRFAVVLRQHGVRQGDCLLLHLPNGADFVVALFAVLLIGAVPVMLLPTHRKPEVIHVAVQVQARLYLGSDSVTQAQRSALSTALRRGGCSSLISHAGARFSDCQAAPTPLSPPLLSPTELSPTELSPTKEPTEGDAGQIALLLLSGGTTGLPKLIPRTHADYSYNLRRSAELSAITATDRYLAVLPMAHNFTLGCPGVLGVWSQGGCVIVPASPAPEDAFAAIDQQGVTLTALVPSLAHCWREALAVETPSLHTLRLIQVGGAKLDAPGAKQLITHFGCQLQQVFGMAEGLLCLTRLDDPPERIMATQGTPMCADDEIRVVNAAGEPVAPGEAGELWVRGPYTLRGYFRASVDNRRAFTPEGFYRTGDRVRLLPDGYLQVEGRIKDVINRHGESISAEEIEACLHAHPRIRMAAVIADARGASHEAIHAVVVVKKPLTLTEVRAFFEQQEMPSAKWPERLSLLTALPLTPLGKVNKSALVTRLVAESISNINIIKEE